MRSCKAPSIVSSAYQGSINGKDVYQHYHHHEGSSESRGEENSNSLGTGLFDAAFMNCAGQELC